MTAFYSEHDPAAAAWLRELIKEGHIAPGVVDTRDIQQLKGDELAGFTQVHLFAGIGGWSLALRLAGWPDDRPVWTGSCPCQPFSSAGKRKGTADARHLWPDMRRLVAERRPPVVFGEQVASKAGREWLAGVRADLEALGFAIGAADLCAAGTAAPHIRQRLWWVADTQRERRERREGSAGWGDADGTAAEWRQGHDGLVGVHEAGAGGLGFTGHRATRIARDFPSPASPHEDQAPGQGDGDAAGDTGAVGRLDVAHGERLSQRTERDGGADAGRQSPRRADAVRPGDPVGLGNAERDGLRIGRGTAPDVADQPGYWSVFDIIPCGDGKVRRVEPGTFPLAHGVSGRVGLLRGYGNAIVPQVAAAFVTAYLEAREGVCA